MSGVLLTGGTGLLGRYVLRQLVQRSRPVTVLARNGLGTDSALVRVDDALRALEAQQGRTLPRPVVVAGSLHEPGLGLSDSDRAWVAARCVSVLHCAASVSFEKSPAGGEPYRTNVDGTQHLLDFCQTTGLRDFHHVSTAYVCGDRTGRILETDLDCGQRFRNDYENSKFLSEQLVRSARGLRSATIYRPSIIVGDSATGYSATFHGFYLPLQLAHWAATAGVSADRCSYMQVLGLLGDERKNLVPVDWVAEVLVELVLRETRRHDTYHLTSQSPVATAVIDRAIATAIADQREHRDQRELADVPESMAEAASGSQATLAAFRERMQVYAAYLSDDPEFDQRHFVAEGLPECPALGYEHLVRMARFAIAARFGWPRPRPRPFVVDVPALMSRLPQVTQAPAGSSTLRLEVTGSAGGVWQAWFQKGQFAGVRTGADAECDYSGYANVHTLDDLLTGRRSVREAMREAHLVLAGRFGNLEAAPALIEDLCRRLCPLRTPSG